MQKISSATARFYPVKLSMEVSFTTHSHIIGRAGTNINTVMKETSTKIHFPDENRVAGEKKSNEVTISGELVNVETARRRIRQFMIPIEYVVECRTEVLDSYGRPALVKDFAILYGVLLRLNEKTTGSCSHCSATIRGSQQEIGRLKEAVNHLMKLNQNLETLVSMKMEFSSDQLETLRANFNLLEAKYSTAFMTLKLTNLGEEHQVVWIRGSVDGVYQTKMALMEFLPMKLMFHVHAIHLTFGVNERKLAKRLDVAVKMEPSTKPSSFLLQIISYEKNAGNIYEFRRQILRLPNPNGLSPIGFPLSLPRVQEPEHESVKMPASICTLKFDKNSYRQLCQLLKESDLFEYCELFLANEVDLAMFTTLSDDDLKSIGVTAYRPRKLMLHAISGDLVEFKRSSVRTEELAN
ncbi:hypothetical protein DAPPUDRAFT_323314 [Daphnia pulex]|uniref:SAM domain-containing protein n=1 Tax=Daphnia pulex TaxID=6669 RepID=E9GYI8_DAPPU|nr:hypothetical protein DAPPUDRAFT_323314 [Daphnia pulex]|eukprot:EFX75400.1 hypothetical protein DAPPUDRAFT_323314 [Daphnia pulex]